MPVVSSFEAKPMSELVQAKYALTGQTLGRPTDYKPEYCDLVRTLSKRNPPPHITEIAVELGRWTGRLYEWAKVHEDFRCALQEAKARHEAFTWRRLNEKGVDPNAMFILKAAHGYTDRPMIEQGQGNGEGQGKVDITIRVLGGKHKRDEAVDVEYQVVSSNSQQDTDM